MRGFIRNYWKHLLVAAIALVLVMGLVQRKSADAASSSVTTATATRRDFVKTISSSGKTKADKSVDLKFQTSGKLAWVGVSEGASVSAYQAIAGLDAREVQKNLEKALRDYSSQRNDFEQSWRVTYDGKTPSDAFNDTVRRVLQKNQWDLEKAVLDVELKSIALEYATLTTPISGIVTRVDTPVAGVNITPATSVFSVSDPASLVFEATVDETDIGSLTLGQPATIMLDAYPEATFSGTISYISFVAQQSSGGATVFPVKVKFTAPDRVRIGLNGDISVETARTPNVLTVPSEAIREDKNDMYVYKKTPSGYVKTTVKTGMRNDDVVIITDGLSEGDTIVTKGFSNLPK